MDLVGITALLRKFRFAFTSESELQAGIAQALDRAGVAYRREHRLAAADRIDFMLAEGLGLEVKIDGATNALIRQVHRYAQHEEIRGLIVVVSRTRLAQLPEQINGKPVAAVALLSGIA